MKKIIITSIALGLTVLGCKDKQTKSPLLDSEISTHETSQPEVVELASEVKIIPIEHATAVLEWNGLTIYIDPFGGVKAFEGQKRPDLILITDIHGDHFSPETLNEINSDNVKIIAPKAVVDKMSESIRVNTQIMANGESKEIEGITIEAIPMYNLREEAKKFHEKGRGNGYVLNIGGERIYFSGDTEDIPEMRNLKNIDKAFICMNLPYTMTEERAADAVLDFKPKQVYPYHYRGQPDVSNVAKFKEIVNAANTEIEVVQLDWYPNDEF